MTAEQSARLDRLSNRRTAYEVVITNGRDTYLLWYSERGRTIQCLHRAIRERAEHILRLTGLDRSATFTQDGHTERIDGTDWIVKATGRTERQAILEGEHPFIKDAFQVDAVIA